MQTGLQIIQYLDKYARWNEVKQRRETWDETVHRVVLWLQIELQRKNRPLSLEDLSALRAAMLKQDVLPSMRIVQMAGPALDRCHVGAFNCAYVVLDSWVAFSELLYILMQGTGCGFSVEDRYIRKLPDVKHTTGVTRTHTIQDTTEGWCEAVKHALEAGGEGDSVEFDYSLIRKYGSPLRTKGGRASGPEPLRQLLEFIAKVFKARAGKFLRSIDAHDIATFIGQIVQVGGVRRAAEISLSDFDDIDMQRAKFGSFWEAAPQRAMANNSAVYEERPSLDAFMDEWKSLMLSGTGERGFFNRAASKATMPARRHKRHVFGTNPCGEIVLRPQQFCNLSVAVARPGDTEESLHEKVRLATIFGTIQSTLTDFNYLRPIWKQNCDEERLLGVDITGQQDCPLLSFHADKFFREGLFQRLQKTVIATNKQYAEQFGIPASVATTCVKPSGNSAQLLGCSSGLHPRYAKYYIRRLRIAAGSPLAQMLTTAGVQSHAEVGQAVESASVLVFDFPVKSPEDAITRHDMTAIDQLNYWRVLKRHWTEHNPSATIYVGEDEWLKVASWVWDNWDEIGGLSFLPKDGGVYQLAPYEEITAEQYETLAAAMPDLSDAPLWLSQIEKEDNTTVNQEFACSGDKCEL